MESLLAFGGYALSLLCPLAFCVLVPGAGLETSLASSPTHLSHVAPHRARCGTYDVTCTRPSRGYCAAISVARSISALSIGSRICICRQPR